VASVLVGPAAAADLAELIRTHSLPQDTPERVARVLARLQAFPDMGQRLSGRWEGTRYVIGPWPWMLIVYEHHRELDRVDVLTIQDARASTAATLSGR
jgi:plasmid stabilization system protein ParE